MNLSLGKQHRNAKKGKKGNKSRTQNSLVAVRNLPGFVDNGSTPLEYRISSSEPYFDFNYNTSQGSTAALSTIFGPLLGSTGILKNYPQFALPVIGGTSVQFFQKVIIKSVLYSVRVLGSQSNTLVGSDLYNTCRTLLFLAGTKYSAATANPLSAGVDNWPVMTDCRKVFADNRFLLSDQSFSTVNNYNAPQMGQYRQHIPINHVLTCVSPDAGATWDTQEDDLLIAFVSDSLVAPAPSFAFNIRVFYEIRRDLR